jgi:integrase
VNQALETLGRLLRIAVERGALHTSPFDQQSDLTGQLRRRIRSKKLVLPSNTQMRALLDEIEKPPVVKGHLTTILRHLMQERLDTGEFARFLAYSGARKAEAANMTWDRVKEKTLVIPGTKSESSVDREIPQIGAMRELLARMRARRKEQGLPELGPMFRVSECQKTLNRACKNTGIERIKHHDLRHFFATACIEAGVDIPTVSKWLGHKDGGALAMRTYGHIRQDHSLLQAAKITI